MSKLDKSVSSVSRISMQIFIEEAWHAGQWTKKKPLGEWDVSPSGYKRDNIPDKKTKAISPLVLGEYRFCLHGECRSDRRGG